MYKRISSCPLQGASIAQWQSTGLVNQGSRVQSSLEAVFYFSITNPKSLNLLHLPVQFTALNCQYEGTNTLNPANIASEVIRNLLGQFLLINDSVLIKA